MKAGIRYQNKVKNGYYHQFARNTLQLNNQNGSFSEIGRFSGVSTTDWSWGALIMDLDNDGWKDIFVANGIYKDLLDRRLSEFLFRSVSNKINDKNSGKSYFKNDR